MFPPIRQEGVGAPVCAHYNAAWEVSQKQSTLDCLGVNSRQDNGSQDNSSQDGV